MTNFELNESFGYLVNRTAIKMKQNLNALFKEAGYNVTTEHWRLLNCLWEQEGLSQSEIALIIEKDKTNVTRILDVMEKNGLIERRTDKNDRRAWRVFLSKKGIELKEPLIKLARQGNRETLKLLLPGEAKELLRLLAKLTDENGQA